MKSPPLVPAEPAAAGDGTPYSPLYDDIYHTAHGGLAQARHVFLAGNDLPARWLGSERFIVFETGFGLALNFLATWQAWRESQAGGRLHFVSVEKHPFRRDDLATLLAAYPELAGLAGPLLAQWPPLVPGFHRLHFDGGRVTLTLLLGDASSLLPQLVAQADALFLDGFAPAKNPGMWAPALLASITRLCRPGATLATWSVAGDLRHTLENLGWTLERRPGFGTKREMLAGRRAVAVSSAPTPVPAPSTGERRAIVIGAGLAGSAVCERLAARGWLVDLLERRDGPAREASGNPAGILLPHLAKDDALAARLSRAAYLYALRCLEELPGVRWSPCGVLQVARDAEHEILQRATIEHLLPPADFAAFLDRDAASSLIGRAVAHGSWWFPGGGWVSPGSLCGAMLLAGGTRIRLRFGAEVASLQRHAGGWQALDSRGEVLASAPQVVLANAHAANRLLPQALPLTPIRGQISCLAPDMAKRIDPPFRHVLCRSGYVTPPQAGIVCVGASFDSGDADLNLRQADHADNLRRLDELLPGAAQGIDAARLGGRVGLRCAAPDRLPLIGSLPDAAACAGSSPTLDNLARMPGLHALLGLSARGMVWAPLGAELLACQLDGEPLPIERDLVRAVDPARFHLRALRRATPGL
ncbi:bifunctional tRNA (5-methylaminomethyl-2-thiouridine)(34)-methyltransferase MnmD/FAD-dependent 5-carboxymethylaminomethyl-2-thiouridine(34) oxidoreductase MnmC [Sulfuritalea sp.]|uniref:bifunctional tRNA (5-methylaminomethyl-2-thiouridine)(34)-methyltransferase MnmD/FAD-dependent 5-carboxymethylaminomethyl-2-thiouridine(34) oxidoreductase MnmC n=1 Tax=Sulfuritalea sp. TaxID=2480090 RepID=UPI001AC20D0A|nr:bifunctional tRNA (5-methylaminomethyl-2-thiouridine)(34)-methyltransferase MnmD/FAD-dependent 5-carboxymethylaminomethyl-2-thiouridine(34) oxidoreductase MnmC [Sulfuritalea sp.]MBN8474368.1 bifunctional tRNA (5-methylaminomethyl-2-thiouridine)(34)-methyltransferase MnmD/FAD-dependent 5-carboxymethylaminomethyl-2-thiouridine(34) oxidoreductase MnmC [Sulfuritalea sp.]